MTNDEIAHDFNCHPPFVLRAWFMMIGSLADIFTLAHQVILSGTESRAMTHGLRSIHDAILVGAGTVRQDDPRCPGWVT